MRQQRLSTYLQSKYGKKLYKVSINAGLSCPNRDGTLGDRGCIFCSGSGSGDFAQDKNLSVSEQIERGKALVEAKLPKDNYGYIAYFQAFTKTGMGRTGSSVNTRKNSKIHTKRLFA